MQKLVINFILLCLPFLSLAQHDFDELYQSNASFRDGVDSNMNTYDLFGNDSIFEITIKSNFKILNRKKDTSKYQKAVIEFAFNDSVDVQRKIGVRARGNFRRENCFYPPLKLDFPKKKVKLEMLKSFDKMKMVGNCKSGSTYDQYLLAEYYVYKMLNIMTDSSFRVRLLKVKYYDTGKKRGNVEFERFAFLIEPTKAMADRLASYIDGDSKFYYGQFPPSNRHMVSIFNYLIGNTDYSILARHNMKTMLPNNTSNFIIPLAIPYDFDYCGIVNPPYAIPADVLPIEDITQRLFRGPCEEFEVYQSTLLKFQAKKAMLYELIQSSSLLSSKSKNHMMGYLDSFYEILDDEKKVKEELTINCN
ncbi:MAG: hypothetical protein ABJH98_13200 [Reichenbachiella sp.]|uniref:hypothetical protein n=1 Tax=Reichenbachiella sp. TaxID=2184521 RepID=UPI0032971D59